MWVTSQLNIRSQFSLILPPFLWVDSSELLSFSKQHKSKILVNRGLLKCTSSISDNTKLRKTKSLFLDFQKPFQMSCVLFIHHKGAYVYKCIMTLWQHHFMMITCKYYFVLFCHAFMSFFP